MKKHINDKRVIILYIVVAFVLILGVAYALGTNSLAFNINTALIKIDETAYGSTTFDSSTLDFKPILDSAVETSTDNVIKIDFTVGGSDVNNNDNIIYDLALVDLDVNCNLLSPYIKWKLIKNDEEISNGSLDYKFDTIVNGRLVLTTIQQDLAEYSASQTGYDDYTFYMWLSDSCQSDVSTCMSNNQLADQSSLIGQNLSDKIEVELYTESKKALERKPTTTMDSATCNGGYLVIYNYEGGTGDTESKNVMPGSLYGELLVPTKDGYTFEGWYTRPTGGGTKITAETTVELTGNQNLYANWISEGYSIVYKLNNGTEGSNSPTGVEYDSVVNISNPTKTIVVTPNSNGTDATISESTSGEQVFAGWTAEGLNTSTAKHGTSSSAVATAWTSESTSVTSTYFENLGSIGSTVTLTANWNVQTFNLPTVEKEGYSCFWNTAADGSGSTYTSGEEYTPTNDENDAMVLYAQCSIGSYVVSYNANGGTGTMNTQTITYNTEAAIASNTYTRTGYTFAGWTTNSNGTDDGYNWTGWSGTWTFDNGDNGVSNYKLALYARWTPKSYTLTVNPNGGTYNSTTSNSTFTQNYDTVKNVGSPTPPTGYKVTYNANGGSVSTTSVTSTKSFSGWTKSGTGLYVGASGVSSTAGITRTAKTESGETYDNFTYSASGLTSNTWYYFRYPYYTYTAGDTYEIRFKLRINSFTGAGFGFRHSAFANDWGSSGWKIYWINSNNVSTEWKDIVLTRTFSGTTINFNGSDHTIAPLFEGYTDNLMGTTSSANFDIKNLVILNKTKDTLLQSNANAFIYRDGAGTLTANYKNNAVTLPTPTKSFTMTYNANSTGATLSATSASVSNTFNGWYTAPSGGTKIGAAGASYTPTAATTLYAQWSSTTITLPTVKKTGYTCKWNTAANGSGTSYASGGSYTASAATTLYASCTANKVYIKYSVNGGTITKSTTESDGTAYTWTTDSSGIIYRSVNGGTSAVLTMSIAYGASTNSNGLVNWDNSAYINITRGTDSAISGKEWICISGCTTSAKTYSDSTAYAASDFCNAANGDCTVVLGVNWSIKYVKVKYNVNGGTIKSSTTSSAGTVYTWTTTSTGTISRSSNGGTSTTNFTSAASTGTINLANWNNSAYVYITKSGYAASTGAEWKCMSGCSTSGKTYNHNTDYTGTNFCTPTTGDCTVELGVNWTNKFTISYNANGGSGAPSSQTKTYGVNLTLSSTKPTRTGYTFLGWSTSSTATSATYAAGGTYSANSGATLYAVWKDQTAPGCTYTVSNQYANAGVTIKFTCSDSGSGCTTASTTYTSVTADKTYTCKDNAGNTKSVTVDVKSRKMYRFRSCSTCATCGGKCTCNNGASITTETKAKCTTYCSTNSSVSSYTTYYSKNCTQCGCSTWGSWTGYIYSSSTCGGNYTNSYSQQCKYQTQYYV